MKKAAADRLMQRTRAAVCYVNSARHGADHHAVELTGFMELFHPEVKPDTVRKMVLAAKRK